MTAKILKNNGEVIYRSTYRGLTDAEVVNQAHIKSQEEFDEAMVTSLGRIVPLRTFQTLRWRILPITTGSTM